MWNRVICTEDRIPDTIRDVETRYCERSTERLAALARIMGGVITPANIARACWNPRRSARSTGIRSWTPKKGAALFSFFMKGRFGRNRNP